MKISFSPPDISNQEINEVADALRSGWITTGPRTKEFEKKIANFCNTNMAVCLNSSTACMEAVLRILGVGPGDEVITSAYTYTATASVIHHVGAKIVMVDTAPNSFEMDYDKIGDLINENTKVIMPVDLGGVICDYSKIFDIVKSKAALFEAKNTVQKFFNRVVVLSDSAHAFGATQNNKKAGEIADFSTFSFHAVKNLTTAEGGALTWKSNQNIDDNLLYKEFMLYSLHGQSKDALSKTQIGGWEYDIITPAYKCNMTDIMAAIGLVQLERYPNMLKRRKEIILKYNSALESSKVEVLPHYIDNNQSSGHLYLVRLIDKDIEFRNETIELMAKEGIATNVHYKPLPMMTAYKQLGFDIVDYPNAYDMYHNEITLPLHTSLTNTEVEYIISTFVKIINR